MSAAKSIKQAIAQGVHYISEQQLANGGFDSFSSSSLARFKPDVRYQTNFVPALILSALHDVDGQAAQAIRHNAAEYLVKQANPNWSFNYWSKNSEKYTSQPYPDDLDDTFCVLSSLYLHDPKLVDETVLVPVTKLLVATEMEVGGPYRTWLVPPSADKVWHDIDLAVNGNINYFLTLVSKPLPKVTTWIDQKITSEALTSPYYPSAYPLAYYLARGYSGSQHESLQNIAIKLTKEAQSSLQIALSLSTLLRLQAGSGHAKLVEKLLGQQATDGSWPADAFCQDPSIAGKAYYNGAASLTTAFVIEALTLYQQGLHTTAAETSAETYKVFSLAVRKQLTTELSHIDSDLAQQTSQSLQTLADSKNGAEIISLAPAFNASLQQPLADSKTQNFLAQLSAANLYGWLAYTIYDDILDGEGQPLLLPTANFAHRRSLRAFTEALPNEQAFQSLVREVFDSIDTANSWELSHCRFNVNNKHIVIDELPDYDDLSKLAERSLGHTLAPLAIAIASGVKTKSKAFTNLSGVLKHYLIVRQLNDDVHDWQDDLQRGQISYVVAKILNDLGIHSGNYQLTNLLDKARKQFWYATLPVLCHEMQNHIELSREALKASKLCKEPNSIEQLLDKLEASVNEALQSQQQGLRFLQHYN